MICAQTSPSKLKSWDWTSTRDMRGWSPSYMRGIKQCFEIPSFKWKLSQCLSLISLYKVTPQKIFVSSETKPSKFNQSSFWKPTQMTKLAHFHQIIPLPWKFVTSGLNGVDEDKFLTITQSTSKDIIHKSETSRLRNLTQMIKVASYQRLSIYKSETPRLWKPAQMIKIGIFHRLMPRNWQIVMSEVLDGVAEDKILTLTQSTSKDSIYKSKMSRLKNTTHMIKVSSCHRLIPWTRRIVTAEGLCIGRAIVHILRKPHLPDSSSRDFENPNENLSLSSQTKCDKMLSDPIRSQIIYFYILLFSYVPGLYFVSSRMW